MAIPDNNATVVLMRTGAEQPQLAAVAQQLADSLHAEQAAISFSHIQVSDESRISTVMESLLAGNPASSIAPDHSSADHSSADQPGPDQSGIVDCSAYRDTNLLLIVALPSPEPLHSEPSLNPHLLEKTSAAAKSANIPVINMLIDHPEFHTPGASAVVGGATVGHKTDSTGKPSGFTVKIRVSYRQHDIALMTRQCISILNKTLSKNSVLAAYPIAPQNPGGSVALDSQTLMQKLTTEIPDWELQSPADKTTTPGTAEITRTLRFRSFQSAIGYMHQVAPACDVANHHPGWENNWRTLHIRLTTWDADQQITDRDLQLARYFDHVYSEFGYKAN